MRDHWFDFDSATGEQANGVAPGRRVIGHMPDDAFVPRGDIVDGEVQRFEAHTYAHHFTVGAQHFNGLFESDIGAGTFDNQPQIIFAADCLAASDHIFG